MFTSIGCATGGGDGGGNFEDFDADEIARRAALRPPRPPARPIPAAAAENSRAMDPALASVTWSDLERISPVVWRRATRLAREFGYDYLSLLRG